MVDTYIVVTAIPDDEITGLTLASDEPTALGSATHFTASITGGTNVSYTWNFGDSTAPVTTDLVANTTHTYLNAGSYTVIVTATNNHATSPKTGSLSPVRVHDPIKNLAADNDSPTVLGNATHFTATITSDPTGVTYAWDFGDGTGTGAGANPSYTYLAAGNYTARVTATNAVSTAVATTPVTVTNQAPVAHAGADQDVDVDAAVQLNGSGSSDPDGHAITYGWQQTGGPDVILSGASTANPTFTAPSTPAVLTFTLTVTDTYGLADATPDEVVVTVNEIGIVGLTASNDSPTVLGQVTNFSALITAGSNVAYSWDFGDGTGTDTGANPNYTYLAAGNYTARVTATNSVSTVVETTPVTITNQAPVANAGLDQNPLVDTVVTLDGSGSSDPDGHAITYGWQQTGGPDVILSGASTANPTFTAPTTPAVLTFALTVTDTYGLASTPDEVVITVYNTPPVADAGPDQNPLVDTVVTLDGSGSSDPDGHAITYGWQQTGGPDVILSGASTANPTFTAPTTPAVLTFALTVTDTYGLASTPDEVVITVNAPPVADADGPYTGDRTGTVTLDGSGSTDPDGTITNYEWQVDGAQVYSGPNDTYDLALSGYSSGTHTVELIVTDNDGATDDDDTTLTVNNVPPVADADGPYTGNRAQTVTLDGSGSYDPDGTIDNYEWQVDGAQVYSGPNATYDLALSGYGLGAHTVKLIVTDNDGATDDDDITLTVNNVPPVADADGPYSGDRTGTVTLDGSGSTDPDGTITNYEWQVDGAQVYSGTSATYDLALSGYSSGTHTVKLIVTDNDGATDDDDTTLTVNNVPPVADADGPYSGDRTGTVTLDGSGSTDPDGTITNYEWQVDGAQVYSGTNATYDLALSGYSLGAHTVKLIVTDNDGATDDDTTTLTVNNTPPVADADGPYSGDQTETVTLDGSGSIDPDGTITNYEWQVDGAQVYSGTSAAYDLALSGYSSGTHAVKLIVTDNDGATDDDTTTLTVGYDPPIADADGPYSGDRTGTVTLDGSGSYDPDGTITNYEWQVDGTQVYSGTSATYDLALSGYSLGDHAVKLIVTDNDGATDDDTTTLTVNNVPPVADADGPYSGDRTGTVTLDGSGSTDPDGTITNYEWQVDGAQVYSGPSATYDLALSGYSLGDHTVRLIVTDNDGATDDDTTTLTVNNVPPVADADGPYSGDQAGTVTLDGSGSTDPDGTITNYEWQVDGTQVYSGTSATYDLALSGYSSGTHTVKLIVTDDDGATDDDTTTLTVSDVTVVDFSSATYSVNESDGAATITVTLSAASAMTVTVDYATSDGTAEEPGDYIAASGTLTFTPGVTSQTFAVTINDDTLDEDDKTVTLTLSNANNANIGPNNPATLTIVDDDYSIFLPLVARNYGP